MKAFAQEPGDPQTSLQPPSTLRLSHPLLHKVQSTFRGASAERAVSGEARGPSTNRQSTRVDLVDSARASSCYRPGSDTRDETVTRECDV